MTRTTHRLLTVLVVAAVALSACGSDDDTSDATTAEPAATSAAADGTTAAADDTTGADAAAATVMLATDAALGDILVDAEGRTLYLFTQDEGTATACSGACADNWPPIIADGAPTAGDGVDAAELGTADGIEPNQVTYHGHLLYYFAGDQAPGDTNGVSIPDWFAVNAAGEAIEPG